MVLVIRRAKTEQVIVHTLTILPKDTFEYVKQRPSGTVRNCNPQRLLPPLFHNPTYTIQHNADRPNSVAPCCQPVMTQMQQT